MAPSRMSGTHVRFTMRPPISSSPLRIEYFGKGRGRGWSFSSSIKSSYVVSLYQLPTKKPTKSHAWIGYLVKSPFICMPPFVTILTVTKSTQ